MKGFFLIFLIKFIFLIPSFGQNGFSYHLSGKAGYAPGVFISTDDTDPKGDYRDLGYVGLDFQMRKKKFGFGLQVDYSFKNSVSSPSDTYQIRNPDVHNILIYLDPWYQHTINYNLYSTTLYGMYTLDYKRFALDLRAGVSYQFGNRNVTQLIAPGNFEPTRVFYSFEDLNGLVFYKSAELSFEVSERTRLGIGVGPAEFVYGYYALVSIRL